jgi:hypothetical protein
MRLSLLPLVIGLSLATATQSLAADLEPVHAIAVDSISCKSRTFDRGVCKAKNASDTLIVVYFGGFTSGAPVLGDDLQWSAMHLSGKKVTPVALGTPTDGNPFTIIGDIPPGEWFALDATKPLLALVFVASKKYEVLPELSLTSPTGASYYVTISKDWSPPKESFPTEMKFSMRALAIQFRGPQPDDLWITTK